jgi:hypothetical protein
MSTSKPLQELVPELLEYIQISYQNHVVYNRKLLEISAGNLLKYVEENLAKELSPRAFERSKGRIPPINIINQVTEKLSKVYTEPANRDPGLNPIDKELMTYYVAELDVDNQLANANQLLNLNKYFAMEPYLDNGVPDMRILPADKFLVWSDNKNDPTAMTVFIKFMGSVQKSSGPITDQYGKVIKGAQEVVRDVAVYHIFSDDEFMILHADAEISDLRTNPFGIIPFVYCSNSAYELIPTSDSDMLAMSILIPTLLTDLNYAVKYLSHSITYGIDVEASALDNNPDAFWDIKSKEGVDKTPQIGTINPQVDTDKVTSLILTQLSMWLDSKGIKTGSVGQASMDNAPSGISKLIDNADSSASNRKQVALFRRYEKNLWALIAKMHSHWVSTQQMKEQSKDFSLTFRPSIKFSENKVIVNTKEVLEELKIMFELGITTPRLALQKLNPDLDDTQIDELLSQIEEFKSKDRPVQEAEVEAVLEE